MTLSTGPWEPQLIGSAAANELVFDQYAPLSFKSVMGGRYATSISGTAWSAPSWVGDHGRRLLAYRLLAAYYDNSSRIYLGTTSQSEVSAHREYGDAQLIVNSVVASLLGDDQTIVVNDAENYRDPSLIGAEDDPNPPEVEAAWQLQEWLRQWATDERLPLKMLETERNAVKLGDGVYTLGWNAAKGRPRLRVWDPGFYFPVLDDGNEDDYPEKVHIAWELPAEGDRPARIRRITWELGPIQAVDTGLVDRLRGRVTPLDGDQVDEETGRITRQYPWNDEPSSITCYLSDGTWELDGKGGVLELDNTKATWTVDAEGPIQRRDIQIDFLPVVHVPNTVAILEHYGRSSLGAVLQILDDLANADTDLEAASSTTGKPVLALSKATMGDQRPTYKAGEILETGDGTMTVLDTSSALTALISYIEFLLARLSVNARLPEAVLGRVKPSEVPSGIALSLGFGPMAAMIGEMRLVRSEKYPLLLKFAHRLALAGQAADVPGQWFDTQLQLGSYLPSDEAAVVGNVVALLTAKSISLETAVAMLMASGLPIEDLVEEIRRIQGRDFEGADQLLTALGSDDEVWKYLGREKPATPVRPDLGQLGLLTPEMLAAMQQGGPDAIPPAAPDTAVPSGGQP